ncbi:PGN_0703 family putative restriction endonuclease [Croceicoccus sediminis]|uniref:PGN_0703 family putative restriction endonuclease n=1 Tax=Croceicoccus sediminis TaxID=2571150 RepID=UPI001183328B|nr:hypothetical protein [Croceicoccus sediminis]
MSELFLPGVPESLVRHSLDIAGGNELASGKFESPESSAALAVNGFGWFIERPALLPPFPGLDDIEWPPVSVEIERQMRFPWNGGRHPWLDAAVVTDSCLIGVESKRFEPFRDRKQATLANAYDRDVWGEAMDAWCAMRDSLRMAPSSFRYLDAAQLVKHAFGLATESRRISRAPVLFYLFAEPARISASARSEHRAEIEAFSVAVSGARVRFAAASWSAWLMRFSSAATSPEVAAHAEALRRKFKP